MDPSRTELEKALVPDDSKNQRHLELYCHDCLDAGLIGSISGQIKLGNRPRPW